MRRRSPAARVRGDRRLDESGRLHRRRNESGARRTWPERSRGVSLHVPFDPELTPGARNAVQVCLAIKPFEKVTLIADEACREIAASLAQELDAAGCRWNGFVLEEVAPRPLTELPPVVAADMETSDV